jgi:HSP20 family protein
MALVRWDPFRDLVSIQSDLNQLFDRTLGGRESGADSELGASSWVPPVDVYENEEKVVVTVELAGIDPEDVDVTVEDSTLTVSGKREFSRELAEENYRRVERRYGSFARSMTLPSTADAERIEARFDKGVLAVEVPKLELAKPKRIEIKATV